MIARQIARKVFIFIINIFVTNVINLFFLDDLPGRFRYDRDDSTDEDEDDDDDDFLLRLNSFNKNNFDDDDENEEDYTNKNENNLEISIQNDNQQCNNNNNNKKSEINQNIDENNSKKSEKRIKLNRNYSNSNNIIETSTKFKIRIDKTVHDRLSLNEKKSVDRQLYTSHYKHKSRSRSRSILSRRSSYSSISCDSDETKRTKKLQSVISKAVDKSSIKCMFFLLLLL